MILFADGINFRRKSFPALFDALDRTNTPYVFHTQFDDVKANWQTLETGPVQTPALLLPSADEFDSADVAAIYQYQLLRAIATDDAWCTSAQHDEAHAHDYCAHFRPDLLKRLEEHTRFWLAYWCGELARRKPSACIVFGGNVIYSRALAWVAKARGIPVAMTEHFFTGHDAYLEWRYEPIPNNSLLMNSAYVAQTIRDELIDFGPAIRKLSRAKNRHVTQPAFASPEIADYCLLLTQVARDFSIASRRNRFKSSIAFYLRFIDAFLARSKGTLVIKLHPYESATYADRRTPTRDVIERHVRSLPANQQRRIHLFDTHCVDSLIDNAAYAVTLNSQAGLQVVARGKPLVCFGSPFYGGKGFTTDANCIEAFFDLPSPTELNSVQIDKFWTYMSGCFAHLIGTGETEKALRRLSSISLRSRQQITMPPHAQREPTFSPDTKRKRPAFPNHDERFIEWVTSNSGLRKYKKLKRDPASFFRDSRYSIVKRIAGLLT